MPCKVEFHSAQIEERLLLLVPITDLTAALASRASRRVIRSDDMISEAVAFSSLTFFDDLPVFSVMMHILPAQRLPQIVARVPVRFPLQVILVVVLGLIEVRKRNDLRHDRARPFRLGTLDCSLGGVALRIIVVEDR